MGGEEGVEVTMVATRCVTVVVGGGGDVVVDGDVED